VAQYQIVCDPGGVHVALALRSGADQDAIVCAVQSDLAQALYAAGADVPLHVSVDADFASRRTAIGKHRLVVQA
jgi:hypothetical protein